MARRVIHTPASVKASPEALARWREVLPGLRARGAVRPGVLEAYCLTWARWQRAERDLAEGGALVRDPASGRKAKSPLLGIARESQRAVSDLERQLGIAGPAGRVDAGGRAEAPADGALLTRRELAQRVGVHMMTITKWERDGMPIAERGSKGIPSRYSLAAVNEWRRARESAAGGGVVDLARERAQRERWQARLAEQQYLARAGELLPRADVERAWLAEVSAVRAIIINAFGQSGERVFRAAVDEGLEAVERELAAIGDEALRELANPQRPVEVPEDSTEAGDDGEAAAHG